MAHYALLDSNYIVTKVITGIDETEMIEGKTPEQWYGDFHNQLCKRTSYNTYGNQHTNGGTPFRGNYASIGNLYLVEFDAFIFPQPYESWKLNYETFTWEAPVAKPSNTETHKYVWAETNKEWVAVPIGGEE
jgi:hypothetical protein